jgi:elongation factor P
MLEYNEIKEGKVIVMDNEPWEVISSHVFRKQQRKPVNATKLKNLISGRVTERSFHVSEKAEEADIETKDIKYLYTNKNEWWFCDAKDASQRFSMAASTIGPGGRFLKQNSIIQAVLYDEKIIGVKLPIKVELKVIEAHPAVKGNTAQGGTKTVKVETGAELNVPMFVKEGDILRINTETGEYGERLGASF